jgi:hypothetical protein
MAELLTTHVTKQELDNGILPMNHVLCKTFYSSEGMKTKSGIIIGVLTDLTYQEQDNPDDDSSHIADFSENAMIVYKLPEKLFFDPEDPKSMPWQCEMELQKGDMVWSDTIEVKNAITLECEGELYKIIPYEFLYVAKQTTTHTAPNWDGSKGVHKEQTSKVLTLNGYVLLSEVKKKSLSELDVTTAEQVEPDKGIVRYIGTPNKRYKHPDFTDFQDLRVGDLVLFDKKASPFKLERTSYNNMFSESGEIFLVCQRRRINMVLERNSIRV